MLRGVKMKPLKEIGVEIYKTESGHLVQTLPMGLSEVIYGYDGAERRELVRAVYLAGLHKNDDCIEGVNDNHYPDSVVEEFIKENEL